MTINSWHGNSRLKRWRLFLVISFFCAISLAPAITRAHQTPNTIILLDVSPGRVAMELQLPLSELELAFGQPVTKDPETLIQRFGPQLKEYLYAHIHSFVTKENPWLLEVTDMHTEKGEQVASGPPFNELNVHLIMRPPAGVSTRKFTLDYDLIMHQVMNHAAFVAIRNDWETGKAGGEPMDAGVIHRDMRDNAIHPFEINLQQGSWWKGFTGMLTLGIAHIKEGTDHLMFLLVLLLPAPLLFSKKRWAAFGGTRYSIVRLLKIVTAFTVGHSLTLILGASGWLRLPTRPVEILIAFSILLSAIHALRPLFPGRELYVAAGFGLIHGLAFASTLTHLNLGAGPMALSILGFNMGIEIMQLFVIAITVPWLIIASKTPAYRFIRVGGAIFASIAAIAWMLQRYSGESTLVSAGVDAIAAHAVWMVVLLAITALTGFVWKKYMLPGVVAENS